MLNMYVNLVFDVLCYFFPCHRKKNQLLKFIFLIIILLILGFIHIDINVK